MDYYHKYSSTIEQLKNIRDQIEKFISTNKDFKIGEDTEHAVRIDKFSDSSIDMYIRCLQLQTNGVNGLK